MQVFNAAAKAIKQGGTRHGANISDILDFIICKDKDSLNNFNSIHCDYKRVYGCFEKVKYYNLYNSRNGVVTSRLNAKEVFDKIVDRAWKNVGTGYRFY
jgi:ribonucleoside-diphosphate reductase alpha chain